jgi:hypothetical protein
MFLTVDSNDNVFFVSGASGGGESGSFSGIHIL